MALRGGGNALRMNGDWLCPRCGDLQFARNLQCRICGTGRPPYGCQGGMPTYEDGGFSMYALPSNGGFNGDYQSYPGSVPYHGAPMHQYGAYPLGPNGKGGPGRPPKGKGFNSNFNGNALGGYHGGHGGAYGGKGLRGPAPMSSSHRLHEPRGCGSSSMGGDEESGKPPNGSSNVVINGGVHSLTCSLDDTSGEEGGADAVIVETLECPHHLAGAVIGRHGSAIAQLRRETRCHIEIEASPGNGASRAVTVCGPRSAVKDAVDRIKETLSQRSANVDQNGEGHYGPGGRVATEEDRQRTMKLIESLEGKGFLRRSWLDDRCMEVLMMLPFDVTGRVLHEAERVDLWKTRNVSAFLMMLVKNTVQHCPDRRDSGDRMHWRPPVVSARPHGPRNDVSNWGAPQAGFAVYGAPNGGYFVPWPGSLPQGYSEYGMVPEYQVSYDSSYMGNSPAPVHQSSIISAPPSPQGSGFASAFVTWDPSGSPQSGGCQGNIAVPVAANGMSFDGYTYAPVSLVPASPVQIAQAQAEVFSPVDIDRMPPLPPRQYDELGTQTPEIGSEIGDLHEGLLGIYPPDVA